MLGKIGGLFEDVARIVRSSHERWDGQGYPDGLAGVAWTVIRLVEESERARFEPMLCAVAEASAPRPRSLAPAILQPVDEP